MSKTLADVSLCKLNWKSLPTKHLPVTHTHPRTHPDKVDVGFWCDSSLNHTCIAGSPTTYRVVSFRIIQNSKFKKKPLFSKSNYKIRSILLKRRDNICCCCCCISAPFGNNKKNQWFQWGVVSSSPTQWKEFSCSSLLMVGHWSVDWGSTSRDFLLFSPVFFRTDNTAQRRK